MKNLSAIISPDLARFKLIDKRARAFDGPEFQSLQKERMKPKSSTHRQISAIIHSAVIIKDVDRRGSVALLLIAGARNQSQAYCWCEGEERERESN